MASASNQPNNSPFIPTQNYQAVLGASNSPFTDERAVAAGGGPTPGVNGNMIFQPSNADVQLGRVTYEDNQGNTINIGTIDQSADGTDRNFTVGSGTNAVSFNADPGAGLAENVTIGTADFFVFATDDNNLIADETNSLNAGTDNNFFAGQNNNLTASVGNLLTAQVANVILSDDGNNSSNIQVEPDTIIMTAQNSSKILSLGQNITMLCNTNINMNAISGGNIVQNVTNPGGGQGQGDNTVTVTGPSPINTQAQRFPMLVRQTGSNGNAVREWGLVDPYNYVNAGGVNTNAPFNVMNMHNYVGIDMVADSTTGLASVQEPGAGLRMKIPSTPVPGEDNWFVVMDFPATTPTAGQGQQFVLTYTNFVLPGTGQPNGFGGSAENPRECTWEQVTDLNGLDTLDVNYDPGSSTLTLSDPVDGKISSTVIVSGRTVLIDDVTVAVTGLEVSCIGLSNVQFPPPASNLLVGNNPPLVPFPNPVTQSTNWFPGASFRATCAGTINDFDSNDELRIRIYSNRGQASETILNQFLVNLEDVAAQDNLGWKLDINFTCRSVNQAGTLGQVASNAVFNYSSTFFGFLQFPEGLTVSNVNSAFDTDITQYLDFTFEFLNFGNSITTNFFVVERIY